MRRRYFKWLIVAAVGLLAACAPPARPGNLNPAVTALPASPQPSLRPSATREATKVDLTASPLFPLEPTEEDNMTSTLNIEIGMQPLIEAASADLMKRLSVTRDSIEVVTAQAVVWPDKSLGCPQAGMQYLQVQVDGYRIELRVGNQFYTYHGGGGRGPFLCESPFK
jgi:hypothetical protein